MKQSLRGLEIGEVFAERYEIVGVIGKSSFSRVYVAIDGPLRRRVAVKLLGSHIAEDPQTLARFLNSASAASKLNHANVLGVYDWGQSPEPFVVSEYLQGGSLADLAASTPTISPSQALLVALQAARGLEHLHSKGLVHLAIKPSNMLFLSNGQLQVSDCGLSAELFEPPPGHGADLGRQASPTYLHLSAFETPPDQEADLAVPFNPYRAPRYETPHQPSPAEASYAMGSHLSPPQRSTPHQLSPAEDIYSLALVIDELVSKVSPKVHGVGDSPHTQTYFEPHPTLGPIQGILRRAAAPNSQDRPSASQLISELTIAAHGMPRPAPLAVGKPASPTGSLKGGAAEPITLREKSGDAGEPTRHQQSKKPRKRAAGKGKVTRQESVGGTSSPTRLRHHAEKENATRQESAAGKQSAEQQGLVARQELATQKTRAAGKTRATGKKRAARNASASWGGLLMGLVLLGAVITGIAFLWRTTQPAEIVVPDLVGLDISEANEFVESFGWTTETILVRRNDTLPNEIVSTEPVPGSQLSEGSELTLVVSLGVELVRVPDLAGFSVAEARAILRASGLVLGEEIIRADDSLEAGLVIGVDLDIGTTALEPQSVVDVFVSGTPDPAST